MWAFVGYGTQRKEKAVTFQRSLLASTFRQFLEPRRCCLLQKIISIQIWRLKQAYLNSLPVTFLQFAATERKVYFEVVWFICRIKMKILLLMVLVAASSAQQSPFQEAFSRRNRKFSAKIYQVGLIEILISCNFKPTYYKHTPRENPVVV